MKLFAMRAAALLLVAVPVAAQTPVRTEDTACPDWGGRDREQYCETLEYILPARALLDVDAGPNGGIQVVGWDRSDIQVVARVRTQSRNAADARDLARQVEVHVADRIWSDGPRLRDRDQAHWHVSYEIRVPRGTELRLEARNGGIQLEDLTGIVDARTVNGGIAFQGGAGRIRGETTNGGLDVELTGRSWQGHGLDLRTTNGGVQMRVPEGYSAELETRTVNGGMDLEFPITVQGRLRRTIRTTLGEGGPLVRAMTTNGGVSIHRP